ncbi:MAG: HXXEE domain-containing protein [Asticcacaulis sp.]|uniref:HXXEE domain-containing protein n=1 Tax=Asticcacaulis sp. TaxID=1872648 RepID=UPI0039E535FD
MYQWSVFDLAFPWIGLAGALVLLPLLFGTNLLRRNHDVSRWRDPAWLGWLLTVIYLIHNVEEYGIDALGHPHAFPTALCAQLGFQTYPNCVIPPVFYLFVNICAVWIAAPLCALLARRHPVFGVSMVGLTATNGIVHLLPVLRGQGYDPGLLTAVVLFFPITGWIVRACFGKGKLPYRALIAILLAGILLHLCLMLPLLAYTHGLIGALTLNTIQALNPLWLIVLPWLACGKHFDP